MIGGAARRLSGAVAALLLIAAAADAEEHFAARLAPVPIEAQTRAGVAGVGAVEATLDGAVLSIRGDFQDLLGAATAARVHEGPVTGVRGPAIFDIDFTRATSGTLSGRATLSPGQIQSLRQGRLYVQLHSEAAPQGNLWGWLLGSGEGDDR